MAPTHPSSARRTAFTSKQALDRRPAFVVVDLLVPNNVPTSIRPIIAIVSGGSGTASAGLLNTVDWTSGTLGAYLLATNSTVTSNIKPTNPIDAFLPATRAIDPGATGFLVYETQVLFDPITLAQEGSSPDGALIFNVSGIPGLPLGSYVLVNLARSDGTTIATANEDALFAGSACTTCSNPPDPLPSVAVPVPSSVLAFPACFWRAVACSAGGDGGRKTT
jgi:hypothetical protein